MSSPEDKGTVTIPADIEGGEVRVRLAGVYLNEALRACGGMADFKVTDSSSPVIFTVDGYQLAVMPMYAGDGNKAEPETPETETPETVETETPETDTETAEAVAEAEKITKTDKPKRSRKKEPVAV
jgi:DNA polymerase-3 subunit beta